MFLKMLCAVGLTCGVAWAGEGEPFICQTWEMWIAENPDAPSSAAGGCPTQGSCDIPFFRDQYSVTPGTDILTVRIYINVFREDNGSNPAALPEDVDAQVVTMNEDFLPYRVQFVYDWRYVDDSTYRTLSNFELNDMKNLYAVDPGMQCNVYVADFGGGLGNFPWDSDALTATGGIVIRDSYFRDQNHVMAHEMGHNLGLWHLHHGVDEVEECGECYEQAGAFNGNVVGDYCADTPPGPNDFGNCNPPGGNDPCSGFPWGDTQRENYMSYGSSDGTSCWTLFTPQQSRRMHCWVDTVLSPWLAPPAATCDVVDLDDSGDSAGQVDFSDLSQFLGWWGPCPSGPCAVADFVPDGDVNFDDLTVLLGFWGPCP